MKPPILSVNLYDPLVRADFNFYKRVIPNTYGHTISAFIGYDTATFTLMTTKTQAEDWIENGLMRHIRILGSALDIVWDGFVDEIRSNLGAMTVTRGPVLGIGNRVYVLYSPLVHGDAGDVSGGQAVTAAANDTTSQTLFGVLPVVISAGTVTEATAELIRDTYLEENREPKTTKSYSTPRSSPVSLKINCKGYGHLLNYPYNNAGIGEQLSSVKISAVLGYTPNILWLPFDTANVDTGTINVPVIEDQYRAANTVIKDVVVRGGAGYERWLFYVLDDLKTYYHAAPTAIEYRAYITGTGTVLQSVSQSEVAPWRLRPGFWLRFDDFLPGWSKDITDPKMDPRAMFIEKVTYRAPYGLQLQGGKTDEIIQVMAQFGMGGAS